MKFACDRCGKTYVLSDDKVKAKSDFRMTCRQCGQVVIVKEHDEIIAQTANVRLSVPEGGVPPPAMPPPAKPPRTRSSVASSASESTPPPPVASAGSTQAAVPDESVASGSGTPRTSQRPTSRPPPPVRKKSSLPAPAAESDKNGGPAFPEPANDQPTAARAAMLPTETAARAAMQGSSPAASQLVSVRPASVPAAALERVSRSIPPELWLGAATEAEKRRLVIVFVVAFTMGTLFGLIF